MIQGSHSWVFIKKKKRKKENTNFKIYMFLSVHSRPVYKSQDRNSKCPSAGDKEAVVHTQDYDPAITERKISTFAATWMNC